MRFSLTSRRDTKAQSLVWLGFLRGFASLWLCASENSCSRSARACSSRVFQSLVITAPSTAWVCPSFSRMTRLRRTVWCDEAVAPRATTSTDAAAHRNADLMTRTTTTAVPACSALPACDDRRGTGPTSEHFPHAMCISSRTRGGAACGRAHDRANRSGPHGVTLALLEPGASTHARRRKTSSRTSASSPRACARESR